ncbi:hypothetical protein [Arthrobacter sp. UM1]|uniref:hypothetical protein n=1 Tax=Arthrobacter sp. UM1 TaxID=2766776 RepID=UPI001CF6ED25|nr:hypothetical protein [Arthrobacter sp. UM1]MCB4208692.1 hypothetical protein [Arthrobacter sp. UM1]
MKLTDGALTLTDSEFARLLTGSAWPEGLTRDDDLRPALAAISEPDAMGTINLAVGDTLLSHTFWVHGATVAFLADLGTVAQADDRNVRLRSIRLDHLPMVLADASGTLDLAAGVAHAGEPFSSGLDQSLFHSRDGIRDALHARSWERVWRIYFSLAADPDSIATLSGVVALEDGVRTGYLLEQPSDSASGENSVFCPASGSAVFFRFADLAGLFDSVGSA